VLLYEVKSGIHEVEMLFKKGKLQTIDAVTTKLVEVREGKIKLSKNH
jgi:hypothetical protein